MDKTLSYWLERYGGLFLGAVTFYFTLKCWHDGGAITTDKYYDILIKASSSLFGFLLAILALLVNGKSDTLSEMKDHDSFPRLIQYHKVIVYLSLFIMVFSVILYSIIAPPNGITTFENTFNKTTFQLLVSLHTGVCVWNVIDTAIFVRIFYKIILSKPQ